MEKMNKHKMDYKVVIITLIVIVLIALVLILSIKSAGKASFSIEYNSEEEIKGEESITPPQIDFQSTEGGTFTGWAGETYHEEKPDGVIVLFASATVPGLTITCPLSTSSFLRPLRSNPTLSPAWA